MSLSEKRRKVREYARENEMMSVLIVLDEIEKQDKEFIKKLKEELHPDVEYKRVNFRFIKETIDTLAGEELIK